MDKELLEIFSDEVDEHIEKLEIILAGQEKSESGLAISNDFKRAVHTLNGSARVAQIDSISSLFGPLEHYVNDLAVQGRPLPIEQIRVFNEVIDNTRQSIQVLIGQGHVMPDITKLLKTVEGLHGDASANTDILNSSKLNDESGVLKDLSQIESSGLAVEKHPEADKQLEYDPELIEIFVEESEDVLNACEKALLEWQGSPEDGQTVMELQRQLHTLKGGARMVGYISIGDLSHALESLIISVADRRVAASPELFEQLHRSLDKLQEMLEMVRNLQPIEPVPELILSLERIREGQPADSNQAPSNTAKTSSIVPGKDKPESGPVIQDSLNDTSKTAVNNYGTIEKDLSSTVQALHREKRQVASQQELIRVKSAQLDHLINSAGEVSIYHARLEQQISSFGFNLNELEQTVLRLRGQLRKLEIETEAQIFSNYDKVEAQHVKDFDPLELDRYSTIQQLSRSLGESASDLDNISGILVDLMRDSETLLVQQSRISSELQEGLMHTRMVRFTGLTPRLRRIVRQTADELGKKVELDVSGETHELDSSLLNHMVAPLEHMVRNAISHGIEPPDVRKTAGKPITGRLHIGVSREGSEIVIRVEDDGAGINLDAVREKAMKLGLIADNTKLSNHEIMQYILESGFTTAKKVTQISGRGVGMDVVNAEIKQAGGVLSIDSTLGKGTGFTVRLPFTLAVNQALLVQSGQEVYAVPLTSIEGLVRHTADELAACYEQENPAYEYAGNEYKLKHLGIMLGRSSPTLKDLHALYPVMLVRSGDHRVAIQVDGLVGNREIVVKPVGPQISKIPGISGATILGDGRVVLILDMAGLVRIGSRIQLVYNSDEVTEASERQKAPTVMVVDDSITIRKVTSRMLERHSFSVLTAKDGIDAMNLLQEHKPDLMLLDIEMPRMDGYELAIHVRNNDKLKDLPIIMITSRSGGKHRQRAMDIGVDRYLSKPYQESDLLENIQAILNEIEVRAG